MIVHMGFLDSAGAMRGRTLKRIDLVLDVPGTLREMHAEIFLVCAFAQDHADLFLAIFLAYLY